MNREVLIRRVARIGVRTVERDLCCDVCGEPPWWSLPREGDPCPADGGHLVARHFITLRNRTYQSEHEVPIEVARRHYRHIREEAQHDSR